jgi:hypothetical protein
MSWQRHERIRGPACGGHCGEIIIESEWERIDAE